MTFTRTIQRIRHTFCPGPSGLDARQWWRLDARTAGGRVSFYCAYPAACHRAAMAAHLSEMEWMFKQPPRELPARLPVIFGRGTGAILMHEALGHPLEGDVGSIPVLWKQIGSSLAHPSLTIADDPLYPGLPACRRMDDEGQPAARRVLVESGILKDLLCDLRGSEKFFLRPGCARVSSFSEAPTPRMTNLVIAPDPGAPRDPFRLFIRFLWVTGVESARCLPPDRLEMEAGPAFVVAGGRVISGHPKVLLQGRQTFFREAVAAVGPRVEPCLTFGLCTKDGRPLPVGAAAPYLAYPETAVAPL